MDQEEIQRMVRTICIYYARLKSNDKRRKKITSKYRELELLTGIKSSTIRQWTDTLDPYFDNDRKGYYQRDLKSSNKGLYALYKEYKDIDIKIIETKVQEYFDLFRGNLNNEMVIDNETVHLYSVKTRDEETVQNILAETELFRIDRINWYKNEIDVGDLLFLILGGDRKPWDNGLIGISVVEDIYMGDEFDRNFEIEVRLLLKFPMELTPEDFYYYPNVKNVINIGPALRGTPNQAINRVPYNGAISIFGAIIDILPELEPDIRSIIGTDNYAKLSEIPRLHSRGEIEKEIIDDELNIDFEGSDDLIDYASLSDDELNVVRSAISDDNGGIKRDLMVQTTASQKSKIIISREPLSVYDLYRKYLRFNDFYEESEDFNTKNIEDSLILEPEFQRNYVWNRKKKIELIESILLGIPLPTFYFSQDMNGNFLVVDGKQRLNAIFNFMEDKESLDKEYSFLAKEGRKLNKITFSSLQSKIQRKIEDYSLNCYVIGASTPPIIQNEIFIRVNRGGVPLNQQEIRNASNVGIVTLKLLKRISDNKELRIVPEVRKKDQYLALRYFAFHLTMNDKKFSSVYTFEEEYENMDNFLDIVMKYLNTTTTDFMNELYDLYASNMNKAFYMFEVGKMKRFTRSGSNAVNMIIFEVWMLILDRFTMDEVMCNAETFIENYLIMINNNKFLNNIMYLRDEKGKILERFDFIKEYENSIRRKMKVD